MTPVERGGVHASDGSTVYGRVIYRDEGEIAVAADPYDFGKLTRTPIDEVEKIELSPVAMMPPGTIFPMNGDELADLMAYLLSGGDGSHAVFQAR